MTSTERASMGAYGMRSGRLIRNGSKFSRIRNAAAYGGLAQRAPLCAQRNPPPLGGLR
jgi:hypothetical protein